MVSDTIKHLGLWALGRFLPKEHVLERHARNIAKSIMLMVMGGLIVTSAFIGGLITLHTYLTSQGLHEGISVAIIGLIAALGATVCFLRADAILGDVIGGSKDRASDDFDGLPANIQVDVALQEGIALAAGAFLSGLRGRKGSGESSAQADLFDLEGGRGDDADEDIIHLHAREKRRR